MNLCQYVKDGTVVFVKIAERDMNKRSKIIPMPKCKKSESKKGKKV